MTFYFNPYKGIDDLKFGMTRNEIRSNLGLQLLSKEFCRSKFSKNSADSFPELGLFVNYDEDNKCDSFELHSKAIVMFNEVNLMGLSYAGFVDFIKYLDEGIVEDKSGCTSFLLGIGVYAPNKDEYPNEKIESIIIFKKGYYD